MYHTKKKKKLTALNCPHMFNCSPLIAQKSLQAAAGRWSKKYLHVGWQVVHVFATIPLNQLRAVDVDLLVGIH